MENQIEIYQSTEAQTEIAVKFDQDSVWLNRNQIATLLGRDIKTIGKHIQSGCVELLPLERDRFR